MLLGDTKAFHPLDVIKIVLRLLREDHQINIGILSRCAASIGTDQGNALHVGLVCCPGNKRIQKIADRFG